MYISQFRNMSKNQADELDIYAAHKLVWRLFNSQGTDRCFIYREDRGFAHGFSIVSKVEPVACVPGWDLMTKAYAPQLEPGDELEFMVRINPTIQTDKRESGRTRRRDMVQESCRGLQNNGGTLDMGFVLHDVGHTWLNERAPKYGFDVQSAQMNVLGHHVHRFTKQGAEQIITLSTMDISGQLTVREVDQFVQMLYNGLGPAKGFGCGLMMVKRPL